MTQVSKKGKRRVELWLPPDFVARIDAAAATVDLTRASFMRIAISAYLKKWQAPSKNTELPEPCSVCGKRHDRNEHFAK